MNMGYHILLRVVHTLKLLVKFLVMVTVNMYVTVFGNLISGSRRSLFVTRNIAMDSGLAEFILLH